MTSIFSSADQLLALSNEQLQRVDPLEMNLLVAKGIPTLANLDIGKYQKLADEWANGVRKQLPRADLDFTQHPADWLNSIHLPRLAILCEYIDCQLGIAYHDDQREVKNGILYTNPSDLFLNGVMDERRGTCGNMSALHVALAWRLGWPVSLACIDSHFIARFDNGNEIYNIESTFTNKGGFSVADDEKLIAQQNIPRKAIRVGSDLKTLTPREMLGVFVSLRARHFSDIDYRVAADKDYALARYLFPQNRNIYARSIGLATQLGASLFDPDESGHPISLAQWILQGCPDCRGSNGTILEVPIPTIPVIRWKVVGSDTK